MKQKKILLHLENVYKTYNMGKAGKLTVLKNINLKINEGEFVAIIGPSGSGKSTLLNLLGGLDRPTSGEIRVRDLGLHEATEKELTAHRRHNVGFIFQTFNLIPTLTAEENVALPLMLSGVSLTERQARARDLLARVGLNHRLDHRPAEMSGGEQQRAAIARALAHDARVLLLDEPFGALDDRTRRILQDVLLDLWSARRLTILFVTHNIEEALLLGSRVLVMGQGRLLEDQPVALDRPRDPLADDFVAQLLDLRRAFNRAVGGSGDWDPWQVEDPAG